MTRFILAREYYFVSQKAGYDKHVFIGKSDDLKTTSMSYSREQVTAICKSVLPLFERRIRNSRQMRLFWKHASADMQSGILFSYWSHSVNQNHKVANVEIEANWLSDPFFGDYYQSLRSRIRIRKIWRMRTFLLSFVRTTGKHMMGLRFDNIHLTVDKIGKKKVYCIHWDNQNPKPWTLGGLGHLLFDDMRS